MSCRWILLIIAVAAAAFLLLRPDPPEGRLENAAASFFTRPDRHITATLKRSDLDVPVEVYVDGDLTPADAGPEFDGALAVTGAAEEVLLEATVRVLPDTVALSIGDVADEYEVPTDWQKRWLYLEATPLAMGDVVVVRDVLQDILRSAVVEDTGYVATVSGENLVALQTVLVSEDSNALLRIVGEIVQNSDEIRVDFSLHERRDEVTSLLFTASVGGVETASLDVALSGIEDSIIELPPDGITLPADSFDHHLFGVREPLGEI